MCVGSVGWVDVFFFLFFLGRGSTCNDALRLQNSLLETWSLHSSLLAISADKQMELGHGNDKKMH